MDNFKSFIKVIFAKWIFKKPLQKDILIYDREGAEIFFVMFEKSDCEIMDSRYESVNFYIIFITLLRKGLKNFKNNYKLNYISAVSPKVVFTGIDNNLAFYKLKDIYDKTSYVSVQISQRDTIFFDQCTKHYSNPKNKKLKINHMFVIGKNEVERFSKVLEGSIHCLGSVKNNHYYINDNNDEKKINSILFVSANNALNKIRSFIKGEEIIFNSLYNFCEKNKIKLSICTKNDISQESFYRKKFIKGNWIYKPKINPESSYKYINGSEMIVFVDSTLGYEALTKGIKCAVFPIVDNCFPYKGHSKMYPKTGPFWSCDFNYEIMEDILKRVINYTKEEWREIINKNSINDIIQYDPDNFKFKSVLKSLNLPFKNKA